MTSATSTSRPAADHGPAHTIPVLKVDDLEAGYGRTQILRGVSITVPPGSVVALIGPNGAGKTTLLKAVSGLLPVRKGSVSIDGADVTRAPAHRRSQAGLCHIPEGRGIYRSLSVRDNLTMQAPRGGKRTALEQAVAAFPVLGRRLSQGAGTMSGGEQQMLAMAAAYVRNPRVVVVDEPSLGLSPVIVDQIFEFLSSLTAQGAGLLVVDQFASRVLSMASTAYVMQRGRLRYSGPAQELLAGDLFAHYLGEQA